MDSAARCPFCHSEVLPDREAWVVCATCVARHHADCWREGGRCAACGAQQAVAAAPPKERHAAWVSAAFVLGITAYVTGRTLAAPAIVEAPEPVTLPRLPVVTTDPSPVESANSPSIQILSAHSTRARSRTAARPLTRSSRADPAQ